MKSPSILTLAAACLLVVRVAPGATLPASEDTTAASAKITLAAGSATTLDVDAKHHAYLAFNLADLPGAQPSQVRYARLRLYFPTVTKIGGGLDIHVVTGVWNETTASVEPTYAGAATAMILPAAIVKKHFASVDVTAAVKGWLTDSVSNKGFVVLPLTGAELLIGAKEGSGSGYPAELEVELDAKISNTGGNTISGFSSNRINAQAIGATIAGGGANICYDGYATVAGGQSNQAVYDHSFVGGGSQNQANGAHSVVVGGHGNGTDFDYSSIGGGRDNVIDYGGTGATIPGGTNNTCRADNAFAAGHRAKAYHTGSFVWADSNDFDFASGFDNHFRIRATAGVGIVTGIDNTGAPTAGLYVAGGSSTWASGSDRNSKENFAPVTAREILAKVAALPITSWNYKAQGAVVRHLGPMSQDFRAAFNVGEDDLHITTIDADGVALAAVQGLNEVVAEKDAEIQQLKRGMAELERKLSLITRKLDRALPDEPVLPGVAH